MEGESRAIYLKSTAKSLSVMCPQRASFCKNKWENLENHQGRRKNSPPLVHSSIPARTWGLPAPGGTHSQKQTQGEKWRNGAEPLKNETGKKKKRPVSLESWESRKPLR